MHIWGEFRRDLQADRPDHAGPPHPLYILSGVQQVEKTRNCGGVCTPAMGNPTMSIRMNPRRERRYDRLEESTGESNRAAALDAAALFYFSMAGGPADHQTGAVEELLELADDQGAVTLEEIVDVLDSDQLRIDYDPAEWEIKK